MRKLSKKIVILLTALLTALLPFSMRSAIFPLSGATGNIHINSTSTPSPLLEIIIGQNISLYFGDVTWSGGQVDLYISADGYASLTIPGDVRYGPTFIVAEIASSTITQIAEDDVRYTVGKNWINGTIPETLEIPGGNYFVKAFDGAPSVAVTDNYIRIVAAFDVVPDFGPGQASLQLRGYTLPANDYANLSFNNGTGWVKIQDLVPANDLGRFVYAMLAPDLAEALPAGLQPESYSTILFRMIVDSTGQTEPDTFEEYKRGLKQVDGVTAADGYLWGNNTDFTGTVQTPALGEMIIAGRWFHPGTVTILWDGTTVIGTTIADATGFFNTSVTVPLSSQGVHKVIIDDGKTAFAFDVDVTAPREEILYVSASMGAPGGWNPLLWSLAWGNNLQYESLFIYSTRDDVWIPWLAENYSWVNKHTLLVKIRDEASWWDGEPVTAQDVKYTYELGKKYAVSWSNVWDCLENITVVDTKTVLFETSEDKVNYFRFLRMLYETVIMPKHRWEVLEEEMGESVTQFPDNNPEEIVASGCYRLDEWSEDAWYYKKVEDWWGENIFGSPDPQYVAHISYESNAEALSAFKLGECDAMGYFIPSVWELWEVEGLPIRTYYGDPPYYIGSGVTLLYINYAFYPLDQIAVRRAVSYAIPYEDLISEAYFNYSVRASPSMVIDTVPAYAQWINDTLVETYGYELNLTRAAQILDDANIIDRDGDDVREMPDGTPLGPYTISAPYGWTDWMMMCDMIASNLQSIGINCSTEFPDLGTWFDRLNRGMFDFVISFGEGMGFDHPWNTFRFVMDPRLTGPVGEVYPSGNWSAT